MASNCHRQSARRQTVFGKNKNSNRLASGRVPVVGFGSAVFRTCVYFTPHILYSQLIPTTRTCVVHHMNPRISTVGCGVPVRRGRGIPNPSPLGGKRPYRLLNKTFKPNEFSSGGWTRAPLSFSGRWPPAPPRPVRLESLVHTPLSSRLPTENLSSEAYHQDRESTHRDVETPAGDLW